MLWLALACTVDTEIRGPAPTTAETGAAGPTGDTAPLGHTGTPPEPVDCALDPFHPLRAWCELGAGATVTVAGDGVRAHTVSGAGRTLVWGLRAEQTYRWSSGPWAGELRTGPLPAELAALSPAVSGALPDDLDAVLFVGGCGGSFFVMVDSDGQVVWYERNSLISLPSHGFEWTADHTLIAVGAGVYAELAPDGRFVRTLGPATLPGALHHDLARWGDYTYVLFEEPVDGADADGVHVVFGDTLIASVRFDSYFPLEGGALGDWYHANGLEVDDEGQLTVSLLNHDTVFGLDGVPGSAAFLTPTWIAWGGATGLGNPIYTPASLPADGFDGQHNALRRDDQLWLFDNGGVGGGSRAARYTLAGGDVRLDAEWPLGRACAFQGGAMPIGDHVLVTCPADERIALYGDGPDPVWSADPSCPSGPMGRMTRAVPVPNIP